MLAVGMAEDKGKSESNDDEWDTLMETMYVD
jgi:hypothetical protein